MLAKQHTLMPAKDIEEDAGSGLLELREQVDDRSAKIRFLLEMTSVLVNVSSAAELFAAIAGREPPATLEEVPLTLLMPAFVSSELKTAFQIGFLVFIPFLIIDLVVASVLMSMGMMMLSPLIISFPFKIMLLVLIDGWALIVGTLASSFAV